MSLFSADPHQDRTALSGPTDAAPASKAPEYLDRVRSRIADNTLLALSPFAILAVGASVLRWLETGFQPVMLLQVALLVLLCTATVLRSKLGFRVKALIAGGVFIMAGLAGIATWGLVGMGFLVFSTGVILFAILLGTRVALLSLAGSAAFMLPVAWAATTGRLRFPFDPTAYVLQKSSWVTAIGACLMLTAIVVMSMRALHKVLVDQVRNLDRRTAELEAAGQALRREIAGRVEAQKELTSNQAFTSSIIQSNKDCIKVLDPDNHLEFISQGGLALLEAETDAGFLGRDYVELWPESDRARVRDAVTRARRGETVQFEGSFPTAKNVPKAWDVTITPIEGGDDSPGRLLVVSRDVTERHNAEKSLKNREQEYRVLFESMAQGVVYRDADFKTLSANPAAERILGLTREQMLEHRFPDERWRYVHPNLEPFPVEEHPARIALDTGRAVRDVLMGVLHPIENRYRWIKVTAVPQYLEGHERPRQVYTTFEDVTDLQEAQGELARAAAEWQSLFDSIADPVVILDADFRVLRTNRAARRLAVRGEIIGRSCHELFQCPQIRGPRCPALKTLDTGEPVQEDLGDHRREEVWYDIHTYSLSRPGGAADQIVFTARDATRRIQEEKALIRARDAAESANQAKTAFIANISHELLTPLNPIVGLTDLILEGDIPAEERLLLTDIRESAARLLTMINDLLELSRLEAGRLTARPQPFGPRELIDAVAGGLERLARIKGLRIRTRVAAELPDILNGDLGLIRKIIARIGENAIKFTETGEVGLEADWVPRGPGSGEVHVTVRDTGIGFPPERIADMSLDFTQADGSMTRQHGGMGLGMTLLRRWLKLVDGGMETESRPGLGSTFHIRFPVETTDISAPG